MQEETTLQLQLAGLDLAEVENVVDDGQQGLGRDLDHVEIVALFARQAGLQGQLRRSR